MGLGLGLGEGEGAGLGVSGSGCGFGVSEDSMPGVGGGRVFQRRKSVRGVYFVEILDDRGCSGDRCANRLQRGDLKHILVASNRNSRKYAIVACIARHVKMQLEL